MAKINAKTIHTARHVCLTTMTMLLMWQTQAFYSNRVTASRLLVTSKQKHPVIWWLNALK